MGTAVVDKLPSLGVWAVKVKKIFPRSPKSKPSAITSPGTTVFKELLTETSKAAYLLMPRTGRVHRRDGFPNLEPRREIWAPSSKDPHYTLAIICAYKSSEREERGDRPHQPDSKKCGRGIWTVGISGGPKISVVVRTGISPSILLQEAHAPKIPRHCRSGR